MAKTLVSDGLWSMIEPLNFANPRRERNFGRYPTPDRACLTGILSVLLTGIQWEHLPQEMGCGCGMTCWRRVRDRQQTAVWQSLHETLLAHLRAANKFDWSRAVVDSSSVRAVGGEASGPNPTNRRKPGSQHHVRTDAVSRENGR